MLSLGMPLRKGILCSWLHSQACRAERPQPARGSGQLRVFAVGGGWSSRPNAVRTSGKPRHEDMAAGGKNRGKVKDLKGNAVLSLVSSGAKKPHPNKAWLQTPRQWLSGGDDAFFLVQRSGGGAVGIADGCSAWEKRGVDPSRYANLLMRRAAETVTADEEADPAVILGTAQTQAKVLGTCTAAAAALDGSTLRAASIGDAGFILLRGGRVLKRSEPQLHSANFPYQLGCNELLRPRGELADEASRDAKRSSAAVQPGDVVILGTDGLLDNLRAGDVEEAIARAPGMGAAALMAAEGMSNASHAAHTRAVLWVAAQGLVDVASRRSKQPGGHLDDISCVVGMVSLDWRLAASHWHQAALGVLGMAAAAPTFVLRGDCLGCAAAQVGPHALPPAGLWLAEVNSSLTSFMAHHIN